MPTVQKSNDPLSTALEAVGHHALNYVKSHSGACATRIGTYPTQSHNLPNPELASKLPKLTILHVERRNLRKAALKSWRRVLDPFPQLVECEILEQKRQHTGNCGEAAVYVVSFTKMLNALHGNLGLYASTQHLVKRSEFADSTDSTIPDPDHVVALINQNNHAPHIVDAHPDMYTVYPQKHQNQKLCNFEQKYQDKDKTILLISLMSPEKTQQYYSLEPAGGYSTNDLSKSPNIYEMQELFDLCIQDFAIVAQHLGKIETEIKNYLAYAMFRKFTQPTYKQRNSKEVNNDRKEKIRWFQEKLRQVQDLQNKCEQQTEAAIQLQAQYLKDSDKAFSALHTLHEEGLLSTKWGIDWNPIYGYETAQSFFKNEKNVNHYLPQLRTIVRNQQEQIKQLEHAFDKDNIPAYVTQPIGAMSFFVSKSEAQKCIQKIQSAQKTLFSETKILLEPQTLETLQHSNQLAAQNILSYS